MCPKRKVAEPRPQAVKRLLHPFALVGFAISCNEAWNGVRDRDYVRGLWNSKDPCLDILQAKFCRVNFRHCMPVETQDDGCAGLFPNWVDRDVAAARCCLREPDTKVTVRPFNRGNCRLARHIAEGRLLFEEADLQPISTAFRSSTEGRDRRREGSDKKFHAH
jgi:hypothetical protein